jgi:hypothetical protein
VNVANCSERGKRSCTGLRRIADSNRLDASRVVEDQFKEWALSHLASNRRRSMSSLQADLSRRIRRMQVQMYLLGRGGFSPGMHLDEGDLGQLQTIFGRKDDVIGSFLRDLINGRTPVAGRIALYALSGREAFWRGAVQGWREMGAKRFRWVLGDSVKHCPVCCCNYQECRDRAFRGGTYAGGFTQYELENHVGYPGQRTLCKCYCKCRLEPILAELEGQIRLPFPGKSADR